MAECALAVILITISKYQNLSQNLLEGYFFKMKTMLLISIFVLQCRFYIFWILAMIINPETFLFGVNFSRITAYAIPFAIGISERCLDGLSTKITRLHMLTHWRYLQYLCPVF